jgi:toxin CcdB
MPFYAVYRGDLREGRLLDCQAPTLAYLNTRLVAPLLPARRTPERIPRLHPLFEIEGEELVMATHLLAAVPVRTLGPRVGTVSDPDHLVLNALDMLISGY